MQSEQDDQSQLPALKLKLKSITSLSEQLERIRSSSSILLNSGKKRPFPNNGLHPDLSVPDVFQQSLPNESPSISAAFQNIQQFSDILQLKETSEALQSFEDNDKMLVSEVQTALATRLARRRNEKVPDLLNYDVPDNLGTITVPQLTPSASPLSSSMLKDFLRKFNKLRSNRKMSVRICCREKPLKCFLDPIIVRMVLEDVLVAYITLGLDGEDQEGRKPLVVEFVNIFGSREAKPLHSSSDFKVFQQLTQYLTDIIRRNPDVSLQSILRILESYRDLFYARCITCDRVASEQGHIPAVARLWKPFNDKVQTYEVTIDGVQRGDLLPSHLTCLQT